MQKVCISISPGIPLRGDILIKCYHKKARSGQREVIWQCQFHTCAIQDGNVVFSKQELDDGIHGELRGSSLVFLAGGLVDGVRSFAVCYMHCKQRDGSRSMLLQRSQHTVMRHDSILMENDNSVSLYHSHSVSASSLCVEASFPPYPTKQKEVHENKRGKKDA